MTMTERKKERKKGLCESSNSPKIIICRLAPLLLRKRTDIFHFFQIIIVFSQGSKVFFNFIKHLHDSTPPTCILFTLHIIQRSSRQCHFFDGRFTNRTRKFLGGKYVRTKYVDVSVGYDVSYDDMMYHAAGTRAQENGGATSRSRSRRCRRRWTRSTPRARSVS